MPMRREDAGVPVPPSAGGAMQGAANQRLDTAKVLRLAPDWERKGRDLSPQEGFLLSRIDGHTPWATLRERDAAT